MDTPTIRAARYRRQAEHLRKLATNEVEGDLKTKLLGLAGEYDAMAAQAETSVARS